MAQVANGPKTTEGAYVLTLTLTYQDQFGTASTLTIPLGVVVVGAINMVVQNLLDTQNATAVTLTGTLLNEGLGIAYYAQLKPR